MRAPRGATVPFHVFSFFFFLLVVTSQPSFARLANGLRGTTEPCLGGIGNSIERRVTKDPSPEKAEIAERYRFLLLNLLPKGQKTAPSGPSGGTYSLNS
ncbi:hypothetical protein HPP92_017918 [Vanilla planifolia]|uniref:Secreted protein n=1 Tax=Vanilla planifolia TaxID=51239 RepID=A0A835QCH2_VANPL|nr:hypothetical protein HPP92_017918 [Vanilla planifolia]